MTAQSQTGGYRLLATGEIIQRRDQPLNDDCESWGDLVGWEIGLFYAPGDMVPIRRPVLNAAGEAG